MSDQVFIAAISLLFAYALFQVTFGNKRDSIYAAAGAAICISMATYISIGVAAEKYKEFEFFVESLLGRNVIYFLYLITSLVLIAVLLAHRAKFKYGLEKTLFAIVVCMLIKLGLYYPVAIFIVCHWGSCI